ncbi:hypothetical protein SASPL_131045 [Salvia splendens]|uniref:BHLH domain-containing protein n=1 Tax=Salvia splendens TaxID=180675 RepID=A0A8X8ZKM6_SALSN|nr:hypothetical protein SASPL_131045 [Salvia splendens]
MTLTRLRSMVKELSFLHIWKFGYPPYNPGREKGRSSTMATANQNGVPDDLREQLALAVRSIQWSYAIFWSFSAKQSGALGWSEGYYNGDIKTRKTVQAVELNSDPLGLQRSDQLRELFESLSLGESTPQPKRPTAALSQKISLTLSGIFWLPGRSYAENEMIWLRNAHLADTKLFARSLLAKASSASLQTVVCFPHLGGVVELGTTELVPEDRGLIQHIKSSFLESSSDTVINLSHDLVYQVPDHSNIPENNLDEVENGADGEASQLQSWQCKDDAVSNGTNNATSSSDCVSQTHGKPELKAQEFDGKKSSAANCVPLVKNATSRHCLASMVVVMSITTDELHQLEQQKIEPSIAPECIATEATKESALRTRRRGSRQNHVLSERKRREKISERFAILGSLVPSGGKVDKVSLLDHTIEYLRELERKVQDLEAYKEATERESTTQSRAHDAMERTSDNYGHSKLGSITKLLGNKKRASDVEKTAPENKRARSSSSTDSITISITDKDVLIEMRCSWRQCVLIQVMEALTQLNLESQSVQSSNTDGILSLSINAKSKGVKGASAGAIKQALQKIIRKIEDHALILMWFIYLLYRVV